MPLVVDDKSKDKVLDEIMDKIIACQDKYHKEWHWLGPAGRAQLRERIAKHSLNYNTIVAKRYNRSNHKMLRPLYDPTPQTKAEKKALLKLIDSV